MTEQAQLPDDDLLRCCRGGDEAAFVTLYRRRQGPVFRFVLQMSGDRALAEEVVQEVFLIVLQGAPGYDPARASFASWLFGVARNQMLRRWARDRRYAALPDLPEAAAPDSVLEDLGRSQTLEQVRRAVLALPETYREAVVLCGLQELTYEEAAAALGCPVGTVRSRLSRGRAMLAERLRGRVEVNV